MKETTMVVELNGKMPPVKDANEMTMPSSKSIPLNVNVEPQLQNDFKALCEYENVNVASAIQDYMMWSIDKGSVRTSPYSRTQLATHFADREIETLKNLAANYSKLLMNFTLLQKRVSHLEQVVKRDLNQN